MQVHVRKPTRCLSAPARVVDFQQTCFCGPWERPTTGCSVRTNTAEKGGVGTELSISRALLLIFVFRTKRFGGNKTVKERHQKM